MDISDDNVNKLRDYIEENGNVIKNFKALCEIMEIEYVNKGKGFKTQREELKCYIKWKKAGHKIIIEEIYDTPFRLVKNPRSTYATSIEYILVHTLKERMKMGKKYIYFNIRNLAIECGFWNDSFSYYRYYRNKLIKNYGQKFEGLIKEHEIEESFNHMKDEFIIDWLYEKCLFQSRDIIKRTLKNLRKKQVIDYEDVYEVQCSGFGPGITYAVGPSNKKEWDIIKQCNRVADMKYTTLLNDKLLSEGKKPNATELTHGQLMCRLFVNGMLDGYYETLRKLYSFMYKKNNILQDGMKFLRIIPLYKISYISKAEYKEIDVWKEAYKLNSIFMMSIYNSFKKKRKQIKFITYSDDPEHNFIIYNYINGDTIDIDNTRKDFDRTEFYSDIDLYHIRYWICVILNLARECEESFDYDVVFDLNIDLVNDVR